MPRARRKSHPAVFPDVFMAHLTEALEHLSDPVWLGEHSPLAAPYLLGDMVPREAVTAGERGRVLRQLLRETMAALPLEEARLLQLTYLESKSSTAAELELHISRATYYGSPQICGRGWGKFPCLTMTCKRKFSNTW